jgi:dihydrolipoamide dehydrogenase
MPVEEVAELEFAFPTFTEGVRLAAQMLVRELGIRPMAQLWSDLTASES